jgi:pyruvate-ferredoxin/flavodoxin oxidoreductase
MRDIGENPFMLDSPRPAIRFREYAYNETRYRALAQSRPQEAEALMEAAQAALDEKYRSYEEMAGWSASRFHPAGLRNSGIAARAGERVDADGS